LPGPRKSSAVSTDAREGVLIVTLAGDVDMAAALRLDRLLSHSRHAAMLIDLLDVTSLDKSCLLVLADRSRAARRQRKGFVVVRPDESVWCLFAWTGLDVQIPNAFSRSRALAMLRCMPVRSAQESREILVHASRDTIFPYLANLEHLSEWRADDFSSVRRRSGSPHALGAKYEFVTRRTGMQGEWVVHGLLDPYWLRFVAAPAKVGLMGSAWGDEQYQLIPAGDATRVVVTPSVEFSGSLRLARAPLVAAMRRRLGPQLDRLKQRIEA
jgi:anti-anti-sigma factor